MQLYYENQSVYMFDACYCIAVSYYQMEEWQYSLKYYELAKLYYKDDANIDERISELKVKISECIQ